MAEIGLTAHSKGKEKEIEIVNLEDIIDVKGWKALGNRLSQHKVTKVRPVEDPEDSGLEEGDDANELVEPTSSPKAFATTAGKATETVKGSLSPKKKSEEAEPTQKSQQSLFKQKPPESKKVKKEAPVQASLFGESPTGKSDKTERGGQKQKSSAKKPNGKANKPAVFTAGQTIELEL